MDKMYCQLWMGNIEPNMTESFISASFQKCGERPTNVKVMRHKYTGEPAGYAFIHFKTDDEAIDAMHKLNGKPIPGTMPVVRFRLNNACRDAKNNINDHERLFSVWVGELSADVDDYTLFRVFSSKYATIKTAKVIIDNAGFSKGYGFVRFGSEEEQKHALYHLDGYTGLGSKAIKICTATPKPKQTNGNPMQQQQSYGNQEYNQYYDPSSYWQNYSAAWSGYYGGENTGDATQAAAAQQTQTREATQTQVDNELVLVDHRRPIDVEQMNKETLAQDRALWDALESCKWSNVDALEVS